MFTSEIKRAIIRIMVLDKALDIERFAEYLGGRVSPGTLGIYLYHVSKWLEQLNGNDPTQELAQRYIDSLAKTLNASTVNLKAHAVMRWFKWRGQPIELDCPTVRIPEPKYVSRAELDKLLASCNTLLEKVLITVLFDTAVRISELLNLTTDDIDWDTGLISVIRKGGRKEEVNISPKGLALLKRWIRDRDMSTKKVFGGLDYQTALHTIKGVGGRAGIELTPHMLRHSRAVQMLMKGATLHDVKEHLGHVNIATTANIYGQFKAIDLKRRIPSW